MVDDKKSTTALWLFVGIVLGLPLVYWIIFYFAALANVELSKNVFGAGGNVLIHVLFHTMTNYVVLLGFTIFPTLTTVTLDNTIYFSIVLTMGALAGSSLWLQGRVGVGKD
jgi:hypothetical protein